MPRHTPVYSPPRESLHRLRKDSGSTRHRKQTWVLRWMAFLALLGLLLVGIQNAYPALTGSDIFRLEQISVDGNRLLPATEVVAWSGLEVGGNLFEADLSAATDRLASQPMIRELLLLRQPPEGLVISIGERRPIALVCTSGGLRGLDREGAVFPLPQVPLDLPVVTGVEAIEDSKGEKGERTLSRLADFVETLRVCAPTFWSDISEIHVEPPAVARIFLVGDGLELRMHFENADRQIRNFKAYTAAGPHRGAAPAYVDLRFRNQVIVGVR